MKSVLHTIDDVRTWCADLYKRPLPVTVAIRDGSDRTLNQNAIAHKWFTEVGQQMGEDMMEAKNRAKLDIGCVILCRDDPMFLGFFHHAIKPLTREQRLKSMNYVDVTSIMTVKQMTEFLDIFERQHRAAGLSLTIPEAA